MSTASMILLGLLVIATIVFACLIVAKEPKSGYITNMEKEYLELTSEHNSLLGTDPTTDDE